MNSYPILRVRLNMQIQRKLLKQLQMQTHKIETLEDEICGLRNTVESHSNYNLPLVFFFTYLFTKIF
jgi:hypothetical protein